MEYEQNTKELETNVQESEDIEDRNIEESFQPQKKQDVKKGNVSVSFSNYKIVYN